MKRSATTAGRRPSSAALPARRGSTLLVVTVLMTMLASLGVIFYMFAAQERQTAEFYSDAAKARAFDLTVETLMDFGLEQITVGPDTKYKNSALYGRRHSLLGNMLGIDSTGTSFDRAPYNGTPIPPPVGGDVNDLYWQINDSPVANGRRDPALTKLANRDPDYTYPDAANVFMSYHGYTIPDPTTLIPQRIVIPSFHRPQSPSVRTTTEWYTADAGNPITRTKVLRPHPDHEYVPRPGQQLATSTRRFFNDAVVADATYISTNWGANYHGFPFAPRNVTGGTALQGEQGVWSSPVSSVYEYDVDNDGDGIREGIWLDLDFPAQEDAAGNLYVPLYSFTIVDADALLNLNAHGNLAKVWSADQTMEPPFGDFTTLPLDPTVAKSNLGVFPTEVNPIWGFNRRPETPAPGTEDGAYPADDFFTNSGTPVAPVNWVEAANREWLFLSMGRYNQSPVDLLPGRWGEEHLLYAAITNSSTRNPFYYGFTSAPNPLANPWPGPGQTLVDDNGDYQQSVGGFYGSTIPVTFGHPLDFAGLGRVYENNTSPKQGSYRSSGLARWPNYRRYSNETATPVQWPVAAMGNMVDNTLFVPNSLMNDGGEVVLDGDSRRPEDNYFGADEMQALHMAHGDFQTATGGSSRLTALAPFNLAVAAGNLTGQLVDLNGATAPNPPPRTSQEFRSKFTTQSWDRKQFSLPFDPTRPWEYNADADADIANPADANNMKGGEFPPLVRATGPGGATFLPYTRQDLFRPLLRRMLEVERNNLNRSQYGLRLNINQLLVGENGNPFPRFQLPPDGPLPPNLELNYRPLTPHPPQASLSATPISTTLGSNTAYPAGGNFTSAVQQEYWARIDRQLMARDLFALLYTTTWPDGINPTLSNQIVTANPAYSSSSPPTIYPAAASYLGDDGTYGTTDPDNPNRADHIRQLAQYAVNIVDSLDRDNIPTRFEYDINLRNGWSLDDNPYTYSAVVASLGIDEPANRNEVWGVERSDLTLSESLVIRNTATGTMDLPFTQWADTADDHYTYVELRNPGPNPIDFSTMNWRIEVGTDRAATPATPDAQVRVLTIVNGVVPIGEVFTIGSGEQGIGTEPSIMKVATDGSSPTDWDTNMAWWIAPSSGAALDLDLKKPSQSADFTLTDAGGGTVTSGALVDAVVPGPTIKIRLMRRASPFRTLPASADPLEEADNPWIMVDEMEISGVALIDTTDSSGTDQSTDVEHAGDPDLVDGDTGSIISAKLEGLRSVQRTEPFSARENYFSPVPASPSAPKANSLGTNNTNNPAVGTGFVRWQKVFDRDFASLGELMQITLGGFSDIEFLQDNPPATTPALVASTSKSPGTAPLAEMAFLNQVGSGSTNLARHQPVAVDDAAGARRWYRVLEFLDVPSRMHTGIPGFKNAIDYPRVPGKMNINLIRHPEVLASLIDDPSVMELITNEDRNFDGTIGAGEYDFGADGQIHGFHPPLLPRKDLLPADINSYGIPTESWWDGFLASRDGQRSGATVIGDVLSGGLFLPGLDTSTPFRSLTAAGAGFTAAEKTLLRSNAYDAINTSSAGAGSGSTPRQLFELGTQGERNNNSIDPYVRRRLLNKIMNNVTTRSNVFVVFVSVKYFRAADVNGAIRIGGPLLPDTDPNVNEPEHRAFYVIDRSNIEKAYDPATNRYNFRGLLQHSQILQ